MSVEANATESPATRRRRTPLAAALVLVAVLVATSALPAEGAFLQMKVVLAGRVARDRAGEAPIRLDPHERARLIVTVTNPTDRVVHVHHVRLVGQALGLDFLTYDTTIDRRVAPGAQEQITVKLDLFDLDTQATGYLAGAVRLLDGHRRELAQQKFIIDVRGRTTSMLGLFAIALLGLTAISVGGLVIALFQQRLSRNRAMRGLQFMMAGATVGLMLALGLPALRITSIQLDGWIPLALGPMAIGFVLGYLAPGPLSYTIEELKEDEILDRLASQAIERLTAERTAQAQAEARESSGGILVAAGTGAGSGSHAAATAAPGAGTSGSAPATTAVGSEARVSGPAPATTAVPAGGGPGRVSGPAPATTAVPVGGAPGRVSGPAPATTAVPAGGAPGRVSGPAPATTAVPVAWEPESRTSGPAPATTAMPAGGMPPPSSEAAPADLPPPTTASEPDRASDDD